MRRTLLVAFCAAAAAPAAGAAAAADEPQGETPSLEYRPPRPVVPEPKGPTPSPPVAIFEEAIGSFGISDGSFDRPRDVAFGPDGALYVLDAGNNRIQVFDDSGRFVSSWGSSGSRPGEFNDPAAIAVDAEGAVYVVDTGNHRVQKFSDSGRVAQWVVGSLGTRNGEFKFPLDIAVDEHGELWVLDAGNDRVQRFDAGGKYLGQWGKAFGSRGGTFTDLVSIASSDERFGMIYLFGAGCLVQQFERDGRLVASWTAIAPESGLCEPGRIESDNREDVLYLLDVGNDLFLKFTRDGRYLASKSGAASPFRDPGGLAVNPERRDFAVADTGNNVVQKFTLR